MSEPLETEDEFDPQYLENAEIAEQKSIEGDEDALRAHVLALKAAYSRVFSAGNTEQSDVDLVLADMSRYCCAFDDLYNVKEGIHADALMKIKAGRREVFTRIAKLTKLDGDTLLKYAAS